MFFFIDIKFLKVYQLNIIKKIKKDYKKKSLSKISKSFYRRKKQQYGCECYKNLSEDEKI